MLLTSYEFILFLVVCIVLYYVLPKKAQWIVLLAGSYCFYFLAGATNGGDFSVKSGLIFVGLLFLTTLLTYQAGLRIQRVNDKQSAYLKEHKEKLTREEKKAYKSRNDRRKKAIMLGGLLLSLIILAVFKYTDFAIVNLNGIFESFKWDKEIPTLDLIMPMGISFYTFQSLGYLLDVYWEKIDAQKNLPKYMLFVGFFPQLIQGPISRYSDLAQTMYEQHTFKFSNVKSGIQRILWGYFKKLVIADSIITAVQTLIGDPEYYTGVWVLIGIIFYGIELYADFTGGIDIVIGIAEVLGIKVEENFIRPYFSKGIIEYWRRWHITMGTWFRDYIFYPMSISKGLTKLTTFCRNKIGKGFGKRVPVYIATMVTWFATGIWHGADWNFIVWGVMNGVIIIITGEFEPLYEKLHNKFPKFTSSRFYAAFQVLRTFLLMGCLRMFDCYRDVPLTFKMFASMFKDFDITVLNIQEFMDLGLNKKQYFIVFFGTLLMFIASMLGRKGSVRKQLEAKPFILRAVVFGAIFVMIIVFGCYGVGYDATQFIYNQF